MLDKQAILEAIRAIPTRKADGRDMILEEIGVGKAVINKNGRGYSVLIVAEDKHIYSPSPFESRMDALLFVGALFGRVSESPYEDESLSPPTG